VEVIYARGGHCIGQRLLVRREGHEYGLVASSTLEARVRLEICELGPGRLDRVRIGRSA
jgi:hypothetical protein